MRRLRDDPFTPQRLSEAQVRAQLEAAVSRAGGQRAFAKLHGFSAAYVNDVLKGRRGFAANICTALGITRTVIYTVEFSVSRNRVD